MTSRRTASAQYDLLIPKADATHVGWSALASDLRVEAETAGATRSRILDRAADCEHRAARQLARARLESLADFVGGGVVNSIATSILSVQGHAIRAGNGDLRRTAYAAMGFDSRYQFQPVTDLEREVAVARCATVALPYSITCDDGHAIALHWTGDGWSSRGDDAARFASAHDADLDLRAARRSIDAGRAEFVDVDEVVSP